MRIIDAKTFKVQSFCSLPLGSAFRFVDTASYGQAVYMRVPVVIDEYKNHLRAIDLEDGDMIFVSDEEEVILCDAEVVVK